MLKILHICKKFPYPVADGETIAMRALSAPLAAAGASLSLLVMNTRKHFYQPTAAGWPQELAFYKEIRAVEIDNRVHPLGAIQNLFSRKSYHVARFESARFSQTLEAWLQQEQFDLVILETPYLAPYLPVIRRASRAAVVLRAHNVECEIWERYAANLPTGPKRWYVAYLAKKLRRFETEMLNRYDLLLAITDRDLSRFREMGFSGNGYVLPVGLDAAQYGCAQNASPESRSIGFLGALDWTPNLEGLQWFLQEVWPRVHREFPEVTLEVAGRNTPDWLLELKLPGVVVLGAVEDARAFICKHVIQLVPIRSGSGVRVKLLECMASGKAALTTTIGLEGVPGIQRHHVLIADSPEAMLDELRFAFNNPAALEQIGKQARALIQADFDAHSLARNLLEHFKKLLGHRLQVQ